MNAFLALLKTVGGMFLVLGQIFAAFWATGNRVLRFVLFFVVVWPFALWAIAREADIPQLTATLAFVPLVAAVYLLFKRPLLMIVAGEIPGVRRAYRWLFTIIGLEVLEGVILWKLRLQNDTELALVLLAVLTALALLAFVVSGKMVKLLIRGLTVAVIVIAAILLLAGRDVVAQIGGTPHASATQRAMGNVQGVWNKLFSTTPKPSSEKVLTFSPGQTALVVPLECGKWSPQVVTPPNVSMDVDISPDLGHELLFADGTYITRTAGEGKKPYGSHRAVFWLKGSAPDQIAVVSIGP